MLKLLVVSGTKIVSPCFKLRYLPRYRHAVYFRSCFAKVIYVWWYQCNFHLICSSSGDEFRNSWVNAVAAYVCSGSWRLQFNSIHGYWIYRMTRPFSFTTKDFNHLYYLRNSRYNFEFLQINPDRQESSTQNIDIQKQYHTEESLVNVVSRLENKMMDVNLLGQMSSYPARLHFQPTFDVFVWRHFGS